jgi:hypothetical protein
MPGLFQRLLAHPLTRGLDIDDPKTTELRREVIRSKPFLKRLYDEWYDHVQGYIPKGATFLELGSGAGFLQERLPELITSEVLTCPVLIGWWTLERLPSMITRSMGL